MFLFQKRQGIKGSVINPVISPAGIYTSTRQGVGHICFLVPDEGK